MKRVVCDVCLREVPVAPGCKHISVPHVRPNQFASEASPDRFVPCGGNDARHDLRNSEHPARTLARQWNTLTDPDVWKL